MLKEPIRVKKLHSGAKLPTYGSLDAAGADLYAHIPEGELVIAPGETQMVHTGICMELPRGFAGLIYARSGMATKRGLAPANKVGVVDPDYRGEILVALHNHGQTPASVQDGERVAQLVVTPYCTAEFLEAETLSETVRGAGGYGSTGYQ